MMTENKNVHGVEPHPLLGWLTVGFIYLLMVWGNLVSATGSGLGCPDWPLCHGTVTPPLQKAVIFEWGHRLLAALATIFMVITTVQIFRATRLSGSLKRTGKTLLVLLGLQILLGGATVLLGLSLTLSTIHLLIANLVFGGFILAASVLTWGDQTALDCSEESIASSPKSMQRLAVTGLIVLLVQLALGALTRHGHAGLACPLFPNCLGGFFPIPLTFETGVAFSHRWLGVLLLGVFVHLPRASKRELPALSFVSNLTLFFAIGQVLLGIMTVLTSLNTSLRAIHAALGYAIWGMLFFIAIRSGAFKFLWKK